MCTAGSPFDECSVPTSARVCACHAMLNERLMCCHSDTLRSGEIAWEVN